MKILVGTDFSESSLNALNYAAELALKGEGEIILAHVFQSMKPTGKMGLNQKIREDAEAEMGKTVAELKSRYPDLKRIKSTVIKGEAHKKLEVLCKREETDLLVIGAQGERSDSEVFLGNVAGKMVQLADMPMLIIPENVKFTDFSEIVFAIKRASVQKKKTLAPLKKILDTFNARLTILQVNEDIKKMKIGSHLSKLANNFVTIESESFYKPIENFVNYGDFDLLCVVRRSRGFFNKFLLSKKFPKTRFNILLPMLVLQGQKD